MSNPRKTQLTKLGSVSRLTKGIGPGTRPEPANPFLVYQG